MIKYLLYIFLSFFNFNLSLAQNINIEEDINLSYVCELKKKILKNSEYNYQTFLDKDLKVKNLDKFDINSKQPDTLVIRGLSIFLSKTKKLDVKVANKNIVLFKVTDKEKNYSETGIIERESGELIHEITKNITSDNFEKDISFYICKKNKEKV